MDNASWMKREKEKPFSFNTLDHLNRRNQFVSDLPSNGRRAAF